MPKRARLIAVVTALCVAGLVSGCGGPTETQDPDGLLGQTWVVTKLVDGTGNLAEPLTEGGDMTLTFTEEGNVGGSGGINQYNAGYEADTDGSLEIDTIASTLMAGDSAVMAQEAAFFSALESVAAFKLEAGGLSLLDADGEPIVRAKPQVNSALEGTKWSCTGVYVGDAFSSLVADTEITALFEAGRMSGSAGVNTYNAKYETSDDVMTIDAAIAMTKMAGEPEAMQQESDYLAALPDVTRYTIEADVLTLWGRSDLRLVTYQAVR